MILLLVIQLVIQLVILLVILLVDTLAVLIQFQLELTLAVPSIHFQFAVMLTAIYLGLQWE